MSIDKRIEDMVKAYEQAPRIKHLGIMHKTLVGIDLLVELYTHIYYQRTGMLKRFTKSDAIDNAVNHTFSIISSMKKQFL